MHVAEVLISSFLVLVVAILGMFYFNKQKLPKRRRFRRDIYVNDTNDYAINLLMLIIGMGIGIVFMGKIGVALIEHVKW